MDPILVGKAVTTETSGNVFLLPKYGNRHGLVAGATGTGKTVTLMTLAEGFSRIGVPVFLADVKGDVAGLAAPGAMNDRIQQRIAQMGIADYRNEAAPVVFWDLWGKLGHPVRTTVSEMGPTLLGRILELNETQGGVLDIVFKLADDRGLLLLDLDDLRALLNLVAEERKDVSTEYGLVSAQSVAAATFLISVRVISRASTICEKPTSCRKRAFSGWRMSVWVLAWSWIGGRSSSRRPMS